MEERIVGILLAAGRAVRFGGDKLLARLPGRVPVGVAACRNLQAALPHVIAVVRPGDRRLAASFDRCGVQVVECARASEGMGATLACGVAASGAARGFVVALADMPWIDPITIKRVADTIAAGESLAAPYYHGVRGHPVGFAVEHRSQLVALSGDEGARGIIAAHLPALFRIDVEDAGVVRDIDRKEDL